jgi:hypothetical protein
MFPNETPWPGLNYCTADLMPGLRREFQKNDRLATHMLSVNCLYQMNLGNASGCSMESGQRYLGARSSSGRSRLTQELASSRSRHSQKRRTLIPDDRSFLLVSESRCLLRASFLPQYGRFDLGMRPHLGHPCQKHPSTKTAIRSFVKKKSGDPGRSDTCILQPRIPELASSARNFSSVVLFPRDLIALMLARRAGSVEANSASKDMKFHRFCGSC